MVRREDSIYYENLNSAKNLPQFPLEKATVLYEGEIEPLATGEYRFCHYYSGYQRIYIDGKPVYTEDLAATGNDDQTIWRTAWNPNARKFSVNLEQDKRYNIRLEWKPDGGEAYCGLRAYALVSETEQGKLSLWSEMTKQLDYYFVAGENLDEVISGYRTLTGKAPIMPTSSGRTIPAYDGSRPIFAIGITTTANFFQGTGNMSNVQYVNSDGVTINSPNSTFRIALAEEQLSIDIPKFKIVKGSMMQIVPKSSYGTQPTFTFTSSDESVATVNERGFITAVGAGTATITATANGKGVTSDVTVVAYDDLNSDKNTDVDDLNIVIKHILNNK
ncbi:Ig-like domain-containing protein [Sodaliphilus sp.]|uniref:Ig-like domain-containing protein n=1 Tax=Sodaliphilus sp. TaxID=2815818 RepID=UPI00388EFA5F